MGLKDQSFNGYVDWVLAIREEIGIPNTLKESVSISTQSRKPHPWRSKIRRPAATRCR